MKCVGLELTFRGGATVFIECESWEHKKSGISRTLNWSTTEGAKRRLVTTDLDEVVCIVEVRK